MIFWGIPPLCPKKKGRVVFEIRDKLRDIVDTHNRVTCAPIQVTILWWMTPRFQKKRPEVVYHIERAHVWGGCGRVKGWSPSKKM